MIVMLNKKTFFNERGSGTLVVALWSIVLLLFLLSFAFDLTKNHNMKNIQNSIAQASAEAGVRKIDKTGSLDNKSIEEAIRVYKLERNKNTSEFLAYSQTNTQCSTINVNGVKRKVPYFEFYLTTDRGSESNKALVQVHNNDTASVLTKNTGQHYKVINMKVYDSVNNFALGFIGLPCQEIISTVKATAFASQEDITINNNSNITTNN